MCAYTKLKLKKGDRKKHAVCPICGHDLVPVQYVGSNESCPFDWWLDSFYDDYYDCNGEVKWIEKPEGKKSRCYE